MEHEKGAYASSYDAACWMSISHQVGEAIRRATETECGIKETIHDQSLANGMEFCAINKNIADHAHRNVIEILANRERIKDSQCSIEKSVMENRYVLADKMDREGDEIKAQMNHFERSVDENFCKVRTEMKDSERRILDRLTQDKLDEKNNLIDELRHMNRQKDQELFIGNQFAAITAMVNSIKQEQEVTNKSIIFGNGANSTTNKQNNA